MSPVKLPEPLFQDFVLARSDKELGNSGEPTKIQVRQATQGENEARNRLFAIAERSFDKEGQMHMHQTISMDDVQRKEVFLTLASCNITGADGNPLFTFANQRLRSETEFEIAWFQLLPIIAAEIIEFVEKVNYQWSPFGQSSLENE